MQEIREQHLRSFERQLVQHGRASLVRSRRSLQKRLGEHEQKLAEIEALGGYTSSIEREIRNFRDQIRAVEYIMERES